MAEKSKQELDAIRLAFGKPVHLSPPGVRTNQLKFAMSLRQRKAHEQKLRQAQQHALAAMS